MIKVLRNQTGISVHTIWIGATLSLLILLVSLPSALADSSGTPIPGNLVVNGSFEDNPSLNQGPNAPQEVLFSSGPNPMPGWTQLNTICQDGQDNPTEFWGHGAIRTAQDGHWLLELDTRRNVIIQQSVPTVAGQQYGLRYYFAARPSTSLATNALRVRVNGVQVNFVTAINSDCSTCRQFSHVITATGSTTTLRFEGAGTIDGLGSLLDNVSLVLVPDSDGDGVQDTRDICPWYRNSRVDPDDRQTRREPLGADRW